MRQLAAVCLAALLSIFYAGAAAQPASFSGTWILDDKESDPFPHPVAGLTGSLDMSGGDILGAGGAGTPSSRDMIGSGMRGENRGMTGSKSAPITVASPPLVIRQSESEMEISRMTKVDDKEIPVVDTFKLDGNENVSTVQVAIGSDPVKVATKATLKKGKITVIMTIFNPNGKSEMKREYSLSKDGKTLTLNTTNTNPRGQLVQKQVYRRQEAN